MTTKERIHGRHIGILGMARSGIASALLAEKLGGRVFISDNADEARLSDQITLLKKADIPYECGGHTERLLESDFVILSPGVPLTIDIISKLQAQGIPIFSEIEFASWVCKGKIIAITGSNGKTTTTTLIGKILKAAGRPTFICGNIGQPFAEVATQVPSDGYAVVEVSTFQLETIADFRPSIALLLNISPDHLDRHGDFETYRKLKHRITENQQSVDKLIINENTDAGIGTIATKAETEYYSSEQSSKAMAFVQDNILAARHDQAITEILPSNEIGIRGPHNLQNAAAATVVASLCDVPTDIIAKTLREFGGVEHRLERVGTVAGIRFVNDSKATNVDSVAYALQSIDTPLYLIAGGRDKGASYEPLIKHGREKIKGIVAIGEAKEKIFEQLGQQFNVLFAQSMEEAVRRCFDLALPGETVLLSPACASFDMFDNYEHRGKVFKAAIADLKNGKKNHQTIS